MSGPLDVDVVSRELLGHRKEQSIMSKYYNKSFQNVNLTGLRLFEHERFTHDPQLQQRMITKKAEILMEDSRSVAANAAINELRWLQDLYMRMVQKVNSDILV